MTHTRVKLSVAAVVLLVAVSYLALAGVKKGWVYHLPVDAYLKNPEYRVQRVRLAGKVSEEGLVCSPGRMTADFQLLGEKASIPVAYRGVIPEMFKAGCEVVVEGKQDGTGVFQSDLMMTKCASKYESGKAGHGAHGTEDAS